MADTTAKDGVGARVGDLAARFTGKKFAAVLIGITAILLMFQQYLDLAGSQYDLTHVGEIVRAAMISIAICVAGGAIGQGIADHGRASKSNGSA